MYNKYIAVSDIIPALQTLLSMLQLTEEKQHDNIKSRSLQVHQYQRVSRRISMCV